MTYRVLIVDDEWRTLEGEAERVRRCGLDLALVGLAESGDKALELVRTERPDIVLCDIHMPGMDGIAFTIKAKEIDPELAIIFISGFSEKEYLRTAVRIGAVDYLYKPVDDGEFLAAMKRAVARRGEALKNRREPALDQERLRLLLRSNDERLFGGAAAREKEDGEFVMLVASHGARIHTDQVRRQLNMFGLHMISVLSEDTRLRYTTIKDDDTLVMLIQSAGADASIEDRVSALCEVMFDRFPEARESLSIGIGGRYTRLIDTNRSYAEALSALEMSFFKNPGTVCRLRARKGGRYEADGPMMREICESIKKSELLHAREMTDRLYARFAENERTPIAHIRDTADVIIAALERFFHNLLPDERLIDSQERTWLIDGARTIRELSENIQSIFTRVVDGALLRQGSHSAIYNARHYIWSHVGGDVSLKTIAAHVYLSPTYLCALFKEVTGQTINQYIQHTRIERAKSLLEDTELPVGEVAEKVGYRNARYFTRVFLSATSVHPSVYRKLRRHVL